MFSASWDADFLRDRELLSRLADQIIVLDHGRVVESGRHEDLILAGGRYAALAARGLDLDAGVPALSEAHAASY